MYQVNELRDCVGDEYFVVNDRIRIHNPTVKEVRNFGEDAYEYVLNIVTRKPYDIAVELWDSGTDYQSISDYELFIANIIALPPSITWILFDDLNFTEFEPWLNPDSGMMCLRHMKDHSFIIDEVLYRKIVTYLRYVHFISEKVEYDMANNSGKKFLIDRMRRKRQKRLKDIQSGKIKLRSNIYSMIRYCVNHPGFKYDYSSVMDLRLSLLYESYYQLQHEDDRQNVLFSIWNGKMKYADVKDKESLQASADLHK